MKDVMIVFGTRPEAIKMAPVVQALRNYPDLRISVLSTGQHKEQLYQALEGFDVSVDLDLGLMTNQQNMTELAATMLASVHATMRKWKPNYVVVHGDTLSTFVGAWAAFLEKIPVGHVEAGLRSRDLREPFPEEANRRMVDIVADLLLAPTQESKENLLSEGRLTEDIIVTGQTGVDAVLAASKFGKLPAIPAGKYVTITLHRRENWAHLSEIGRAIRESAKERPDLTFVVPLHLNPVVRQQLEAELGREPNVELLGPLPYASMAALIRESELLITDSGGLQEEGAALHIPVAVARNKTERPDGLRAGTLVLIGNRYESVSSGVRLLLNSEERLRAMRGARNPFGDGRASQRVAAAISWRLGLGDRPMDWLNSE